MFCRMDSMREVVNSLLHYADQIFDTAREGTEDCEVAILVQAGGAIRMIPAAGWSPEALRLHHGAGAVYRVSRNGPCVRVEAQAAGQRCELRSDPGLVAFTSCPALPQYQLISESD